MLYYRKKINLVESVKPRSGTVQDQTKKRLSK
ncbi:Putative protein [Zobellia galactanivorans]|uniref:Uncharacterized protein n=1 Tax=Zobellia galactanivorans (strain DSM 12802 / CCUG 47099 / CIP 106680 / NCIMB 13871 / Dsij) TaxID=63186 RepID=G0L2Z0_ZOBGA|nr:Putative protein [Zobellia galactanivorans]